VAQERLEDVLLVRIHRHITGEVVLVRGKRHGVRKTTAPLQRQTHASKSCHGRGDLRWPEEPEARNSNRVTSAGDGGRRRSPLFLKVQNASNWLGRSALTCSITFSCSFTSSSRSTSARATITNVCSASIQSATTTSYSATAASCSSHARIHIRCG